MSSTNYEFPSVAYAMFGYLGITFSIAFSCLGSAYGIAKAGVALASMGILNPSAVMRNMIPVVMAGVLGIYGLITSIIALQNSKNWDTYTSFIAYAQLSAGLSCGFSSFASGYAIGDVGESGLKAVGQQPSLFVATMLIQAFANALGLYGLIVSMILNQKKN